MTEPDVLGEKGKTAVLLGNEAIVRGALEAGVAFVATYPGTPSSEIGLTMEKIAKKAGFYFEWSTNEKVAFEAAAGAAFSGVKAMTAMKHFGLNVACDSVFSVMYTGVKGPLVIMVADDPEGYSSAQSEEDSRYFSRIGYIPTLEPSNIQECKEFTKLAFEMSEKYEIPVMLRTTTRVSHAISQVRLGEIKKSKKEGNFEKSERYYNLRPALQELHQKILEKIEKIEEEYGGLNKSEGKGKIGLLTNGVSYQYLKELKDEIDLEKVKIGKLNLTYPLSKKFISEFIKDLEKIIIIEELESIIEDFVRQAAKEANYRLEIHGKDIFPRFGEFSPDLILEKISPFLGKKVEKKKTIKIELPPRKPTLCAGCPHRSTFYALRNKLGKETVWAGDIGCYMLGVFEPTKMQDFFIAMGAGEGLGHGIKKVSKQRVVAFIGDSTFFHAGIPALINMKVNGSNSLVVIMDNGTTAMTGHQPNPGTERTSVGEAREAIKIENIVKALGIENYKVANAFNQKELQKAIEELNSKEELGVLISRGECRLLTKRKLRKEGKELPTYEIEQTKCTKCLTCLEKFNCPAITQEKEKIMINPELCWGCGVCSQLCPTKAIRIKKKEKSGEK